MSNFSPILVQPPISPYWLHTSYGGYNRAILINSSTGSVLPNCVGWAWGAFLYHGGLSDCSLSTGNAKNWYGNTADGYQRGSIPKLGAIACWAGDNNGYGHVACVEIINSDGTVTLSNSDAAVNGNPGVEFYIKTAELIVGQITGYVGERFQGYIYNPYAGDTPVVSSSKIVALLELERRKQCKRMIMIS